MISSDSDSGSQTRPPYGAVKHYKDFFELLERVQIDEVDSSYLKTHKIASGNEYKFLTGLKFLGLIDENGNATDRMNSLRVVGDEYTKNFEKMVRDAYSILLSKVELEKAIPDDIVNGLIRHYGLPRSTAPLGAKIFIFLAEKAGISVSEKLAEMRTPKLGVKRKRGKRIKKEKKLFKKPPKGEEREGNYVLIPEGMVPLRLGDRFILFLQKGKRKTREKIAKIAKQWIDTYVEEEELETEENKST
jgi:hypothetical protein